ncbi:hypothetical protein PDY_13810 [Photobacterium damselae subsp. damselae]|nr:hypothetical protein PDY_13810 [Photobacterium damselae subsp. damselae]
MLPVCATAINELIDFNGNALFICKFSLHDWLKLLAISLPLIGVTSLSINGGNHAQN